MRISLAGLALACGLLASAAHAGPSPVVRESVAICDPNNPAHCVAPDLSGNLPVTIGGGGAVTIAPGAVASGAYVDCALVTIGCEADAVWGGSGVGTAISILKSISLNAAAALPAGTNNIGLVTPQPTTTSGVTTKSFIVANNITSVAVDANPGTLLAARVFGNSGTPAYLKFYNASQGSTTCGSGTPVNRVGIPSSVSGGGANYTFGNGFGVAYSTAISVCVTGGIGDADVTVPNGTTFLVEVDYK